MSTALTEAPNPYRPGPGRQPAHIADHDALLADVDASMEAVRSTSRMDRPIAIAGAPGTGKTVLVSELVERAHMRGWLGIRLADTGLPLGQLLARAAHDPLRRTLRHHSQPGPDLRWALSVFRTFQLRYDARGCYPFSIDVGPIRGAADSGDLALDLADLLRAVADLTRADNGVGLVVMIDDLHELADADLDALHKLPLTLGRDPSPPMLLVVAGESDAIAGYSALYDIKTLNPLADHEAARALSVPARDQRVFWTAAAVQAALEYAAGHPLRLQAIGKHSWDNRRRPTVIDEHDVGRSLLAAQAQIDDTLYTARWERATPAEQQFLESMANDGDEGSRTAIIADRLGRRQSAISAHRDALLKKRVIWTPRRGELCFTTPGMAEFIRRRQQPH